MRRLFLLSLLLLPLLSGCLIPAVMPFSREEYKLKQLHHKTEIEVWGSYTTGKANVRKVDTGRYTAQEAYEYALYLKMSGRFDEALSWADKALAIDRSHKEATELKIELLEGTGRIDEAAQVKAAVLLSMKPEDATELDSMISGLAELGRYDDAIALCDKAIKDTPAAVQYYLQKGVLLRYKGRLPEAVEYFDKAIAMEPDGPLGYSNKAYTLIEMGRYEQAVVCFDRAAGCTKPYIEDPKDKEGKPVDHNNDSFLLTGKSYALSYLGKHDEAVAASDKALAQVEDERDLLLSRAIVLKRRGKEEDMKAAGKLIDDMLAENSRDIVAAYCFALKGSKDELFALMKDLIKAEPFLKADFMNHPEFDQYRGEAGFVGLMGR